MRSRYQRIVRVVARPFVLASIIVGLSAFQAVAQMEGGHGEHGPNIFAPNNPTPAPNRMGAPSSGSTPGMGPGIPNIREMMGGRASEMTQGAMGEMGEMGGRPRKEFYPSLMAMPTLSPEQRKGIEAQARTQINSGTNEINNAAEELRRANAAGDAAGAEQAASRLRDALNQVKSADTTLRSLTEGKSPQQIGQAWFKARLNVAPTLIGSADAGLGLTWFHVITMSVLVAFAATMLFFYLFRLRRANALVQRLTSGGAIAAPSRAPSVAPAVPPTAPPGITATAVPASPSAPPSTPASGGALPPSPLAPPKTAAAVGPWKGKLEVAAVFRETGDVKTFRLKNPQGGPIPFTFLPGQFLTYSAEIDGKLVRRSYTIASSAAQTAYVETTIKREEPGIFSDHMHDKVAVGDALDVVAPSGTFTFTGKEADSVVLIGGGVGITPLMSAIRYLFDSAWPGDIFLVYGAQTTENFIFRDELEYLQRRMHNLHVAATMARAAGTSWMGAQGHITKEFLVQSVPEIVRRRVHLCGPPGMMEAMKKTLAELGVPAEQVKTEAFGPARGAVPPPGVTQVVSGSGPAAGAGQVQPTAAAPVGPATATIRFAKSNKVVPLPPDKTVLEIAESVGVPIDYACRVGICGTCKTQLLEGEVIMEVEDALTVEDKARNIILACQAKSVGNLVVEA
jgi:ferredoxin-NADP reductase